jgi:hypothetical protein
MQASQTSQQLQQQQQPSVSAAATASTPSTADPAVCQTQQLRVRVKDIKKLVHAAPDSGGSEAEQPAAAAAAAAPPPPAAELKKYEADPVKKVFWKKFEAEKTWTGTPSPEPQVCRVGAQSTELTRGPPELQFSTFVYRGNSLR